MFTINAGAAQTWMSYLVVLWIVFAALALMGNKARQNDRWIINGLLIISAILLLLSFIFRIPI